MIILIAWHNAHNPNDKIALWFGEEIFVLGKIVICRTNKIVGNVTRELFQLASATSTVLCMLVWIEQDLDGLFPDITYNAIHLYNNLPYQSRLNIRNTFNGNILHFRCWRNRSFWRQNCEFYNISPHFACEWGSYWFCIELLLSIRISRRPRVPKGT